MSAAENLEVLKAALNLAVAVVTIALGWVLGQRLTVYWNLRQKQREYDMAAAREFQRLYGEFFAVWKLWNYHLKSPAGAGDPRSELLSRACTAEGSVESLFVRLASSRALTEEQARTLGRFRQGYQLLRQAIRDNRPLAWRSSAHPEYVAFKTLATEVALIIASELPLSGAVVKARAASLLRITSNEWEQTWS
jgi:hypothetical protein